MTHAVLQEDVAHQQQKQLRALDLLGHLFLAGISNSAGQTVGHPFDLLKLRLQIQGRGERYHHQQQHPPQCSSSGRSAAVISNTPITPTTLCRHYSIRSTVGVSHGLHHQALHYRPKYGGPISGLRTIVREEGAIGLFSAWRISVVREWWVNGVRVGMYEPFKELLGATDPKNTPLRYKISAGLMSGTLSSIMSTPLDLMKVRYQAVSGEEYRKLPSPTRGFMELMAQGPRAMWRGFVPNTFRAAGITATHMATYDHVKHTLLNRGILEEGTPLHVTTSIAASLTAVAVTNPLDVIKTRMMNYPGEGSMKSVAAGIYKQEGGKAFYKGALLGWLRLGPHTVVTFTTFEYLRKLSGLKPL